MIVNLAISGEFFTIVFVKKLLINKIIFLFKYRCGGEWRTTITGEGQQRMLGSRTLARSRRRRRAMADEFFTVLLKKITNKVICLI